MKSELHIHGHQHVTGQSEFVGEGLRPARMFIAKPLPSEYAHAKILRIDIEAAKKIPGVHAVLTASDIPGENQIGHAIQDEVLFPKNEVMYVGQPIALVVAENNKIADHALTLIQVDYEPLTPILSIEKALETDNLYIPKRTIERGHLEEAFQKADCILEDLINTGAQEHWYLETQRCWAIPEDDKNITLYSATQSTSEIQEIVARILNITSKDVTVDVKRLGGAFGGKERSATIWACMAALAAWITHTPVEIKLNRLKDQSWTGKRHPFRGKYKIGFNKDGKVLAYDVELCANGGAYADLSAAILERAMLHADNAYYLPNVRITGYACRTNLPPNTAFRGFGAPQGIFMIEHAMNRIAHHLKMDETTVRAINFYKEAETTPYEQPVYEACNQDLLNRLKTLCHYDQLVEETNTFNQEHPLKKRGIGIVPVKFGISFTASFLNQGSSLIWIYPDGSISLSHGGIEMGQEINTKIAQIVAEELGISIKHIRNESANTKRVGNASPTAASSGTDINGNAAYLAVLQLKERLAMAAVHYLKEIAHLESKKENIIFQDDHVFDQTQPQHPIVFSDLTSYAYMNRINLGAHGFYKTPGVHFDRDAGRGLPFYYFVFGIGLVQMEVDLLTGMSQLLKTFIVHETARTINQEIDRGQIAGAFYQGFGLSTMEELPYDDEGRYLATTPSTYKIPSIRELPEVFEIELVEHERKHASVLGSKGIGEPPLIYGEAAYFAIKNAIQTPLTMPATSEAVVLATESLIEKEFSND